MKRLNLFALALFLSWFTLLSYASAIAVETWSQPTYLNSYLIGTSRAQSDQEVAKIRRCIVAKAKISNVVRLEECLP